ncbi:hypothetical protein EC957_007899 [Mortierella hygrophila]|uniref:Uncharacterized protein n=1 Tax=Mortierella hygrophila TaxID=979708 RepID=A0A9P6FDI7_9FUNG|nr:hypothetical protein EC957_007899 [Mortierella hygrophila]
MSPTLSTPSSEASSSITTLAPYSKQPRVTRATIFIITLTLACCLLSSTTTFAAPAAKPQSKNLLRQRSLAHQVHHVQVADESVHNTVVLLKKSIQKRKSQKRSQSPQQQHPVQQGHTTKEKKTKRHVKREMVDSSFLSASVPEDHTASNDKDIRVEGLVDLDSIGTTTTETRGSSSTSDDSSAAVQRSYKHVQKKKKQSGGGHHRARLLSAYESIIFSESQIPVFLTQDHHHQRPHRSQPHRQRKGANVSKKNNAERHHQNPIIIEATVPFVDIPSSSGDDVAMAHAGSPSPSLDSELEQQHTTTWTVAQDASASNNNNLQTYHVAEDETIAVGVTEDEPSENDDKNSSLLLAAASASPILQVEQDKEDLPSSIATEEGVSEPFSSSSSLSFASGSTEAIVVGNDFSQGADSLIEEEEAVVSTAVVVVEDESSSTADEIESGWVTITDADLVDSDSDNSSNIDSNPSYVEFQSPAESDDIPLSDNHHQRDTGTSLFHNGCSSSSVITLLGGLLLTVFGLVYRFYIRKQQLQKQQARRLGASLPLDAKAPLSTKSSEGKASVHRLSVDSVTGLMREGDSGRTTAMRDYVGFNMQ